MKKLLALVFLLALPALGDVTISNTFTDGQAARIDRGTLRAATPEIRFGQSAFWTRGSIGTSGQEGCAAGVAYHKYIRVSLHDLPRSYSLVSWEAANQALRWTLDRGDLGDGPVVSAATAHAAAQCGN